jgi:hypothetical protein
VLTFFISIRFNVYAVLGEETFPVMSAASKKEGNVQAAEAVLKALAERGQYLMPKAVTTQVTYCNCSCLEFMKYFHYLLWTIVFILHRDFAAA